MLVFDKSSKETFENVSKWLEEVNKFSEVSTKLLLGNKDDLKENCEVEYDLAHTYASENAMEYVETSALNSHQITQAFEILSRHLIQKCKKENKKEETKKVTAVIEKQKTSCC